MNLSPRSVTGVTSLQALALVPSVIVGGWSDPATVAFILVVTTSVALGWEVIFAIIRKRAFSANGITTVLIVSLFCPFDIVLWQLAISISLGVVFGELICGGRGFGFVSPAALSLSILIVAFPDVALRSPTLEIALAVLPGLALLLAAGLVSLSVLMGIVFGALATFTVTGQIVEPTTAATALSVGAVFLIADPTAASTTMLGRWVYGVLAGALVVVFSPGEVAPEAVVAAALLASVFAPLIDHGTILLDWRKRRVHRHG